MHAGLTWLAETAAGNYPLTPCMQDAGWDCLRQLPAPFMHAGSVWNYHTMSGLNTSSLSRHTSKQYSHSPCPLLETHTLYCVAMVTDVWRMVQTQWLDLFGSMRGWTLLVTGTHTVDVNVSWTQLIETIHCDTNTSSFSTFYTLATRARCWKYHLLQ